MDLSYSMLKLQPQILLLLLILICSVPGGFATVLFKKYIKIKVLRSHNEVIGYIFAAVGGFYALLLGFVVFLVWSSFSDAQTNANREGSMAKVLYRDIKYFPDTVHKTALMKSFLDYVTYVVDTEYKKMEAAEPFTKKDREKFNTIYKNIELMNASDSRTQLMFQNLNELSIYRSLRQLDASASSDIPVEIWIPLILGGLIVLTFAALLDIENGKLHALINSLLGAFVGLVIYIIITLDHPFTGKLKVEPEEYISIGNMVSQDK